MASDRPEYTRALLSRPLPALSLSNLTARSNPPYSAPLQSQISDGRLHPLLETTLHLLNSDLFSAHFLARKMEKDDTAKWLHSFLHAVEGDLRNARCWVRDTPETVLAVSYRGDGSEEEGTWKRKEYSTLDCIGLLRGLKAEEVAKQYETASVEQPFRATLEDVQRQQAALKDPETRQRVELEVRQARWDQLENMLQHLESRFGYRCIDGTEAYDSLEEKRHHTTTMVLGEGWRRF